MFIPNTESFLSDIREPSYKFFKFQLETTTCKFEVDFQIMKNISIQFRYAQYFTLIYICTVKYYEHTNPILENIFLSSLISFRNGFVLGTNIQISIFK